MKITTHREYHAALAIIQSAMVPGGGRPGTPENDEIIALANALADYENEPCASCGSGKIYSGLPGGNCESCMNTRSDHPELVYGKELAHRRLLEAPQ